VPTIAEITRDHVTLTVDCIDRIYCNAYVPRLQTSGGMVGFLHQRGWEIPSPAALGPISDGFAHDLRAWATDHGVPWLHFEKGQRKDDIVEPYRSRFTATSGVVLIGVAQERATAWRARKETSAGSSHVHFSYYRTTVYVNHYYIYFIDAEWGPGFLKICSYAPYAMKLCLNGHEWAKRQLTAQGVAFEALDNGFLSCVDPAALQSVCDRLAPADILACFDRWCATVPLPLTADDRRAGFSYRVSILQVEISRTQVFDRPRRGREFFEQVIRDNLDLGRPDRVQLLFDRKIIKTTPGRFRTRVITRGVIPSLHIEYKRCQIKQYFKEGRALRTETTVNDAYDFGIGRGLSNFGRLRELGQQINTRVLEAERADHDGGLAEAELATLVEPGRTPSGQAAPGLKLGQPRVTALLQALCLFAHLPSGLTNARLRSLIAQLLALPEAGYTARQMGYDLRCLARKGLIERQGRSFVYQLTPTGRRTALFLTIAHARLYGPGVRSVVPDIAPTPPPPLRRALTVVDQAIATMITEAHLHAA
jgi:hypothetical protein